MFFFLEVKNRILYQETVIQIINFDAVPCHDAILWIHVLFRHDVMMPFSFTMSCKTIPVSSSKIIKSQIAIRWEKFSTSKLGDDAEKPFLLPKKLPLNIHLPLAKNVHTLKGKVCFLLLQRKKKKKNIITVEKGYIGHIQCRNYLAVTMPDQWCRCKINKAGYMVQDAPSMRTFYL